MAKIYDFKTKALLADLPTELTPNPMPIPIAVNDSSPTFFKGQGGMAEECFIINDDMPF